MYDFTVNDLRREVYNTLKYKTFDADLAAGAIKVTVYIGESLEPKVKSIHIDRDFFLKEKMGFVENLLTTAINKSMLECHTFLGQVASEISRKIVGNLAQQENNYELR